MGQTHVDEHLAPRANPLGAPVILLDQKIDSRIVVEGPRHDLGNGFDFGDSELTDGGGVVGCPFDPGLGGAGTRHAGEYRLRERLWAQGFNLACRARGKPTVTGAE